MRKPIPAYVDEMVEGAVSRLNNLRSENTVAFAFVTDTHNCMDLTERSLYAIDRINQEVPISFTCLGGDYLCNNSRTKKETALKQLEELKATIAEFGSNVPIMVAKGNHDDNPFGPAEESLHPDEIYDRIMSHHRSQFVGDPEEPKGMYGYYDIPGTKMRAIFLNSMDVSFQIQDGIRQLGIMFGNRQLNWLANTALKMPEKGWSVVLFSHIAPVASPVMFSRAMGGDALWEILRAFQKGSAYHGVGEWENFSYEVSCDFHEQGAGKIIAYIVGHNHADRKCVVDGIPLISTSAAASDNFDIEVSGDGTYHYKTRGSGEESAFTIFTVDPDAQCVSWIRCGAGPDGHFSY